MACGPLEHLHCKNENDLHEQLLHAIDADVDCIFGIYEGPDSCGHGIAFSNHNYFYTKSISDCDRCAYELMERVRARETYAQEDWLILITSDHGGHKTRHGIFRLHHKRVAPARTEVIAAYLHVPDHTAFVPRFGVGKGKGLFVARRRHRRRFGARTRKIGRSCHRQNDTRQDCNGHRGGWKHRPRALQANSVEISGAIDNGGPLRGSAIPG